MFKNYIKLALKVLMRRKMFTFINLFGIFFTLTILLAATAVYTSLVVSNPVENNLSKTLFLRQVSFHSYEKGNMSSGRSMPYVIESCVKPFKKNTVNIAVHSARYGTETTYINNKRIDIDTKETDENYWHILSFDFVEGRPYTKDEVEQGQKVIVICQSLAFTYFGDASALGKPITVNNKTYKVVGVVKDVPKIYQSAYAEFWSPIEYASYMLEAKSKEYNSWSYDVLILMKSKADIESLRKQFAKNLKKLTPPDNFKVIEAKLETPFQTVFGMFFKNPVQGGMLVAVIILALMMPILNLTNLTVSRIFERSSEIGVRKAFGSTKKKLIFQFLFENSIITLLGGILSFIGAWLLLKALNASGIASFGKVDFSFLIFTYGLIVIILFALISGLYPALKMSKLQIVETMKGGNK